MSSSGRGGPPTLPRRDFLLRAGGFGLASLGAAPLRLFSQDSITLPFDNGERPLVQYPQKRPLIRLTTRPPQLETPFAVFNEGVMTPNDAFFVRYHLTVSPPPLEALAAETFRVEINGKVKRPLKLSVSDLKSQFEPMEVVAVNECSGNGRGFFEPRVPGGQLGNGAMGNARWKGARLKDVLEKAALEDGARHVTFDGLDRSLMPQTPDFVKVLEIDHALGAEVLLAYEMNGQELPWLNGYPLRLVVPGYYGTYWVKHVHRITVLDNPFNGYWMTSAYRVPDNACACVPPGESPQKTVPITRLNVRSFITSIANGAKLKRDEPVVIQGIAFDGGYGIREVLFSENAQTWREAELGADLGRYSFHQWSIRFTPDRIGTVKLRVKATNRIGQSQPTEPLWNPAGYMRNVVESVEVVVV